MLGLFFVQRRFILDLKDLVDTTAKSVMRIHRRLEWYREEISLLMDRVSALEKEVEELKKPEYEYEPVPIEELNKHNDVLSDVTPELLMAFGATCVKELPRYVKDSLPEDVIERNYSLKDLFKKGGLVYGEGEANE